MSQTNRRPQQRQAGRSAPSGNRPGNARSTAAHSRSQQYSRSGGSASGGNGRYVRDLSILSVGGIIVIVLALMLQKMWPDGFPLSSSQKPDGTAREISTIYSNGPIRINEIMSADKYCVMTQDDEPVDWIEVINIGSSPVDLEGYRLAKTANSASVFTFPSITLDSGECVIVFADSKLRNVAGEELHAPFRLSSGGDTLMLFNTSDTAIDTVNIPALGRDISYARMGNTDWQVCEEVTPGLANTHENYVALTQPASSSSVVLNEIVARNSTTLADANGQYYDYIELHNVSGSPVNIGGWYLSDDEVNVRRWRFPDVTIEPDGYLIVYCSGLDKTENADDLHTNFGLNSEGEHVILSDDHGRRMDEVTFDLMKKDVAYARGSDSNWSMTTPTPGKAN